MPTDILLMAGLVEVDGKVVPITTAQPSQMTRHHMLLLASRVFTIDADELFYAHPRTPAMEDTAYDLYDEARSMCEDVSRETTRPLDELWEEAMAWFHRSRG